MQKKKAWVSGFSVLLIFLGGVAWSIPLADFLYPYQEL
jgi:hypothetical protein